MNVSTLSTHWPYERLTSHVSRLTSHLSPLTSHHVPRTNSRVSNTVAPTKPSSTHAPVHGWRLRSGAFISVALQERLQLRDRQVRRAHEPTDRDIHPAARPRPRPTHQPAATPRLAAKPPSRRLTVCAFAQLARSAGQGVLRPREAPGDRPSLESFVLRHAPRLREAAHDAQDVAGRRIHLR